jgi:hypothetical protein
MNREEHQKMMILADTIEGEINRMCVTDSLAELDTMADHAIRNIEKLQNMRFADLVGERKEE